MNTARPLRVLYSIGPGDVVAMHEHHQRGDDDQGGMNVPYARLFLQTVDRLDGQAWIISANPRREDRRVGRFRLTHRPDHSASRGGLAFHAGQVLRALRLVFDAARFRADVAIVGEGGHLFALAPMRLFGTRIVPSLHCVLWPKYKPLSRAQRTVRALNRWFMRRCVFACMAVSHDIAEQVVELAGDEAPPVLEFVPHYRRERFDAIDPPVPARRPFRVFFAGRIERNKGPFDLLKIATALRDAGRTDIVFDIAGRGPALEALKTATHEAGLEESFRCHGFCGPQKMVELLSASHVVAVPTTIDFVEGFNKVVAEGVMAGRPVITSAVVPALAYVRDAVVEVAVDDPDGYRRAILELADDPDAYEAKRMACAAYREPFFDAARHWGAAATAVLTAAMAGRRPAPVCWSPEAGGANEVDRVHEAEAVA